MTEFKATAQNDEGDRFQFSFKNPNWNGVCDVAAKRLEQLVSEDALHQRLGPWYVADVDIK